MIKTFSIIIISKLDNYNLLLYNRVFNQDLILIEKVSNSALKILLSLVWLSIIASCQSHLGSLSTTKITCDYSVAPIGLNTSPSLLWVMKTSAGASYRSAYQIMVASNHSLLAEEAPDLWDLGKVDSDQSPLVAYQMKALASAAKQTFKISKIKIQLIINPGNFYER